MIKNHLKIKMNLDKKNLIKFLLVLIISFVFVGSILATYFGKKCLDLNQSDNLISSDKSKNQNYRLAKNLKPFLYDISIKVDFDLLKFNGKVNISFNCLNSTNEIVLNLKDLSISNESIRIYSHDDKIEKYFHKNYLKYDKESETLSIMMYVGCIVNNTYSISMNFSSKITDNLEGFYKSSYYDLNSSRL